MGATFAGARRDDIMYQLLFFFIGPSNLGKSELKRIIRALFGPKMWHQPDLNIWGRPFAAGAQADFTIL